MALPRKTNPGVGWCSVYRDSSAALVCRDIGHTRRAVATSSRMFVQQDSIEEGMFEIQCDRGEAKLIRIEQRHQHNGNSFRDEFFVCSPMSRSMNPVCQI